MAAAVADFRPRSVDLNAKLKRSIVGLHLDLEPTPDLLAGLKTIRRPNQVVIGFALEPRDRLVASAKDKLIRKHLDLIVANPLEAMDSALIEATIMDHSGTVAAAGRPITKEEFASQLLEIVRNLVVQRN
jgi:phosphopantothenoylcysteine decarboxylase/phosphopantothenate--cysteine ligase